MNTQEKAANKKIIVAILLAYMFFYLFEGVIRFGLYFEGASELIFLRDILLVVGVAYEFLSSSIILPPPLRGRAGVGGKMIDGKALQYTPHPNPPPQGGREFFMFISLFLILLHGTIGFINTGSLSAVLYGTKILFGVLAGAIFAPYLFFPPRWFIRALFFLWIVSFIGLLLDKYFINYPWMGMSAIIGDMQVEISRDWTLTGAEKRVAGFMRSSIHAAIITPLLALLLIKNLQNNFVRFLVAMASGAMVFWTTQKGSLLSFAALLAIYILPKDWRISATKTLITTAILLQIIAPILLPYFSMPHGEDGVFSFASFYMRIEEVWPAAWRWIDKNELFPFGVGLGGIGGAMRLYAPSQINYADNSFIFLYGYFGIFSLIYLWLVWWRAIIAKNLLALQILGFLLLYGCVISGVEDQMAALFLGAGLAMIARQRNERKYM